MGGEGFLVIGGNGPTSYDLFRNDNSDVTIDADGTVSAGATRGMESNLEVREAVMRGRFESRAFPSHLCAARAAAHGETHFARASARYVR